MVQALPVQAPNTRFLEKEVYKSVIPTKETAIPNKDFTSKEFITGKKVIIPKEVLSNIKVFNFYSVNKIKYLCIQMDFHIQLCFKTLSLTNISSDFVIKLIIYYLHYKDISKIIKCAHFLTILPTLISTYSFA